jgi:hypothetical protein
MNRSIETFLVGERGDGAATGRGLDPAGAARVVSSNGGFGESLLREV